MHDVSFDAILFDCDGTLVDSESLAMEVYAEFAAGEGVPMTLEQAHSLFAGEKMANTINKMSRWIGRSLGPGFEREVRARMDTLFKARLQPIEGARELLAGLDVPYCVVSNGPRSKMDTTLSVTGLDVHLAGRVFSAYEVGVWKPEPGLFLHAADALGVNPGRCAVVEDTRLGLDAGIAAGMHVFGLARHEAPLDWPPAVTVLSRLLDLRTHL